mmetsp:Transcript_16383/g.45693  ORF Transcript_16383/g.45693 Transcript_16383/m.45693 type:complete len:213 (+) Transcript_16383:179-817(+)
MIAAGEDPDEVVAALRPVTTAGDDHDTRIAHEEAMTTGVAAGNSSGHRTMTTASGEEETTDAESATGANPSSIRSRMPSAAVPMQAATALLRITPGMPGACTLAICHPTSANRNSPTSSETPSRKRWSSPSLTRRIPSCPPTSIMNADSASWNSERMKWPGRVSNSMASTCMGKARSKSSDPTTSIRPWNQDRVRSTSQIWMSASSASFAAP